MTTITTRAGKGSPLLNSEVDANFTNLNDDKIETSGDSMTGDLSFGDSNKAIFGASSDLQLYHSGTESWIKDTGTGSLYIDTDGASVLLTSGNSAKNMVSAVKDGAVTLYNNNTARLATTSTGIDVTGTAVTDGLTVDGTSTFNGNVSFGDNNITNVGSLQVDDIAGDTDGNTFIQFPGSDVMDFYTGNTKAIGIDASQNVSIPNGNLTFADNGKAVFGAGSDLQIYHDGSNSYIDEQGTGSLNIRSSTTLRLQNASGTNYLYGTNAGEVVLYHNGSPKLSTTSTGIDVTGTVVADGIESSGGLSFTAADGIDISGKESVIIRIDSDDNDAGRVFQVRSGPTSSEEILIQAVEDAGVSLYYDGSVKFATTSTGIDVTGTVTADGLTVDGIANVKSSGGKSTISIGDTAASTYAQLLLYGGATKYNWMAAAQYNADNAFEITPSTATEGVTFSKPALKIDSNRDISFFEDTGTTAKLFWDASAESLGIGTSTAGTLHGASYGTTQLHIDGGTDRGQMLIEGDTLSLIGMSDNGATADSRVFVTLVNDGVMTFKSTLDNGSTKADIMSLTSAGNVGIGDTTPSQKLDVNGNVRVTGGYVEFAGDTSTPSAAASMHRPADNTLALVTANTERMRIDSSGNVGIGSSSPNSYTGYTALTLNNATNGGLIDVESNGTRVSTFFGTASQTNFGTVTATPLVLLTNNTEAVRIDSSGNVGIGTSSPAQTLHLKSADPVIRLEDSSPDGVYAQIDGAGGGLILSADGGNGSASSFIGFRVDGTASGSEKMRIDSSGQLLLGRGANVASGAEATRIQFYNTNSTYDIASIRSLVGAGQVNRGELSFAVNNGAGQQERMRLDYSGTLNLGTTLNVFGGADRYGYNFYANGQSNQSIDGTSDAVVQYINRENADGPFTKFYKDRVEVGSIGVASEYLYIHGTRSSDAGLMLGSQTIAPASSSGANRNNEIDLGFSGNAFKDLYLSGTANASALTTTNSGITLQSASVTKSAINVAASTNQGINGTAAGDQYNWTTGGKMLWSTNSGTTAHMILDGSGNVLVGTTTSAPQNFSSGSGTQISDGYIAAARGGAVALLNRVSTDGDIVEFKKDGTAVGSIGAFGGDLYIGTNDSGLRFEYAGLNAIIPFDVNSSAISDAATDLGHANARFKNLYLSGSTVTNEGVYFGSAVAANHLDDYEEGTFTPALTNAGTPTYSRQYGIYRKVGKLVSINLKLTASSISLAAQTFGFSGLPFTATDTGDNNQRSVAVVGGDCQNLGSDSHTLTFRTDGAELQGVYLNSVGSSQYYAYNQLNSSSIEIHLSLTYMTA